MGRDNRRLRIILVLLVLTSLTFLTLDQRNGNSFSGLRSAASTVFGPIQRLGGSVGSSIGDTFSGVAHGSRDRDALKAQEQRNAQLQQQINDLQQAQQDEAALKALGFFAGQGSFTVVPARVIGVGEAVGSAAQTITLSIGSTSGVAIDQAVVTGDGLVGRVVQVGPTTSVVDLVDDPSAPVSVRLADGSSQANGLLTGHGPDKPLTLTYDDPQLHLTVGQKLVTFQATFPPDIAVGTISKPILDPGTLEQTAEVTLNVNLDSLDVVGVVTALASGTVLPVPATTVSPSPSTPTPAAAPSTPAAAPSASASAKK